MEEEDTGEHRDSSHNKPHRAAELSIPSHPGDPTSSINVAWESLTGEKGHVEGKEDRGEER